MKWPHCILACVLVMAGLCNCASHPAPQETRGVTRFDPVAHVLVDKSGVPVVELIESIDHRPKVWESSYPYACLWRRMKDEPAMFCPKDLPAGFQTVASNGEWVVDPQDGARFFAPNTECGGLSSTIWKIEARKAINKYTKSEQEKINRKRSSVGRPLAWLALFFGRFAEGMSAVGR